MWDLLLPAPAELDAAYLARVSRVEDRLRQVRVTGESDVDEPGLTKVFSLADVVAAVSPVSLETLSRMPSALTTTSLGAIRTYMPESFRALHAADPQS